MARKATPIGPHVLALIEDARVDLRRAALAVWEGGDAALSRQTRHRSFRLQAGATIAICSARQHFRRIIWYAPQPRPALIFRG